MSTGETEGLPLGPVQMLAVEFDRDRFHGEILPELRRLSDAGIIRLLDLLVVAKHEGGDLESVQMSDLSTGEAEEFGALIGALVGFGAAGEEGAEEGALAGARDLADGHLFDEDEVWFLADAIPEGSTAAIALIEHRWAIPLRDKIADEGGVTLADQWIHPADLIAVGAMAAVGP
jgi:uncharacterized membrane protein